MKGLKRQDFDVILPPPPGGGGGGGGTPPPGNKPEVSGVQQLPSDGGDGDEESPVKSKPYTEKLKSDKKDQKKDKDSGDGGSDGESGEESQSGEGGGDGKEKKEGSGVKAKVSKVEDAGKEKGTESYRGRGIGGILSEKESAKLQEELGVPFEAPPSGKEIKDKVRKLQPLLDKGGSKQHGLGKGSADRTLPDAISRIVNPVVDWKNLLKKFVGRILAGKTEAIMPNRRFVSGGAYVYGTRKKDTKLNTCVIAIDVSGSIGQKELMVMINEVKGIAQAKGIKSFELVYFDHGIQHVDKLTDKQVAAYQPKMVGGGGTTFKEPLEYMNQVEKSGKLDLAVFMTDGYANLDLPMPKFKNKFIWMILDHPSFQAPWGNKVVFVEVKGGKSSVANV